MSLHFYPLKSFWQAKTLMINSTIYSYSSLQLQELLQNVEKKSHHNIIKKRKKKLKINFVIEDLVKNNDLKGTVDIN